MQDDVLYIAHAVAISPAQIYVPTLPPHPSQHDQPVNSATAKTYLTDMDRKAQERPTHISVDQGSQRAANPQTPATKTLWRAGDDVKVGPRILGAYFGFPRAPRILGYLKHSNLCKTAESLSHALERLGLEVGFHLSHSSYITQSVLRRLITLDHESIMYQS
jgi:hypothetical protein